MPRVESSVNIDRPVEIVWDFLTSLENAPKWDIGVRETRGTSKGPAGLGTTFQNIGPFLGRESVREFKVTQYVFHMKVAVTLMNPSSFISRAEASYSFRPEAQGTRLTFVGDVEFKGIFKVIQPILATRARRDGQGDLENLKRLLETGINSA
jgi:hypothetical protein